MSTLIEDVEQIKQACREIGRVAWAPVKPTRIGRFISWSLKKRDDALEDLPPRAIVVLAAVLYVAFVVFWCWAMRGMMW